MKEVWFQVSCDWREGCAESGEWRVPQDLATVVGTSPLRAPADKWGRAVARIDGWRFVGSKVLCPEHGAIVDPGDLGILGILDQEDQGQVITDAINMDPQEVASLREAREEARRPGTLMPWEKVKQEMGE